MKKRYIAGLILTGSLSLYSLVGFVILPKVVVMKLPEVIKTNLGREASLADMAFNPFSLNLQLVNFSLKEKNSQDFVRFDEFKLDIQFWQSIQQQALVISELSLTAPYVNIEMLKDKQFNFSDLLTESKPKVEKQASAGLFPVVIQQLAINKGNVNFIDATKAKAVKTALSPIDLSVSNLSTLHNESSQLGFSLVMDSGMRLQWRGDFGITPLFSKGNLEIDDLPFNKVWELALQERVNFKWLSGTQAIKFDYDVSYHEDILKFNLANGALHTKNLVFANQKNESPLVIPDFSVSGIDLDLTKQQVDIAKIETQQLKINAFYNAAGLLNIAELFAPVNTETKAAVVKEQTEPTKPWRLAVKEIAINNSDINYADTRKEPNITATLPNLSFKIEDYQLVSGDSLSIDFKQFALSLKQTQLEYGKDKLFIEVPKFDVGLKNYKMQLAEILKLTADKGYLTSEALELKTPTETLVSVPLLAITGVDVNLQNKQLNIASILTKDARLKAWLDKQGVLNYQALFASSETQDEAIDTQKAVVIVEKKPKPWQVNLAAFDIQQYGVEFTDYTHKKPTVLNLADLNFSLNNFKLGSKARFPIKFNTQFNQQGTISLAGTTALNPLVADLDVVINEIALADFQAYAEPFVRLDIIKGNLNLQGKLAVQQQAALALRYQGDFNIDSLHTRDQILNQDFLKWKNFSFKQIDFNLQPLNVKIKQVHLEQPYTRFTIKKDKTTNISDVIVTAKKTAKQAIKPKLKPVKSKAINYNIGEIKLSSGQADFSDYSLVLPFVVAMNDLDGKVNKVSSHKSAKMKIDIVGKAFDLSPLKIKGELQPNLDDLDIGLYFNSLPLPLVSPYMAEFAGYKIEKGKMSIDLLYQIQQRKLSASNNVLIDQLVLGEPVESPNAVDLPLSLAIALLKDKDGKIKIDMPLQGSLDDPEFSVAPLLWDTFLNLVTKAVASPFKMLGALFEGEDDLSTVNFLAGEANLTVLQIAKLDKLSEALLQKPNLSLEIKGRAFTNQDWPKMNADALLFQLKQLRANELKAEGKIELAEYIQLSEKEHQRLLADLFISTFPELAKRSFFGTPELTYPDMGEFYTVADNMLTAMIKPDANKLAMLSVSRAQNIARYLLEQGHIKQSRLFILDGDVLLDSPTETLITELSLKVQ